MKIVAGALNDETVIPAAPDSWAVIQENEVAIWVVSMEAEASWTMPIASKTVNRSIYFFEGESIELSGEKVYFDHSAAFSGDKKMVLKNGNRACRFLFLQGKPIEEKVVQYGPFVMNSNLEIQQAMDDYQRTRFGGWPWPRPDLVHRQEQGRFAKYADGKTDTP